MRLARECMEMREFGCSENAAKFCDSMISNIYVSSFSSPEADALPDCATRRDDIKYLKSLTNHSKKHDNAINQLLQENELKRGLLRGSLAAEMQQPRGRFIQLKSKALALNAEAKG